MPSYTLQYTASVFVTIVLGMLTAIQASGGTILGIGPQTMAWLAIIGGGLGVLSGFLPRVTAPPNPAREGKD